MQGLVLKISKLPQTYGENEQKKKEKATSEDATPDHPNLLSKYRIWGYYDRLEIQRVQRWQDLEHYNGPEGESGLLGMHDEFPLKLLAPEKKWYCSTDGFDYEWDGQKKKPKAGQRFIAIAMLHLSKDCVSEALVQGDPTQSVQNLFGYTRDAILSFTKPGAKGEAPLLTQEEFCSLHCSCYFTTGFSDMVLLFNTDRLDLVSDLVYAMRAYRYRLDKEQLVVSTSYLVCGMHRKITKKEMESLEEETAALRISLRFLLKPGLTPHAFYRKLLAHLKDSNRPLYDKLPKRYSTLAKQGNLFSQMYGNSDVLLLPDIPLNLLLPEFTKHGSIYKGSTFCIENISSTRSSIRRIPDIRYSGSGKQDAITTRPAKETADTCRKDCMDALLLYTALCKKCLETSSDQPRLLNGIQQLLHLYAEFAAPPHAFDLCSMLSAVLNVFTQNIRQVNGMLQKYLDSRAAGKEEQNEIDDIYEFILTTNKSIQYFRHDLNELMLDFSRADRQFVEGRTLLHVSIASATKLVLAYYRMLQTITDCLQDKQHHDPSCQYDFLVCSGGVDKTQSIKLFNHIEPQNYPANNTLEYCLLKMQLPERTLFRPGAAIYLLTHEALHFVGYRDPVLRGEKLHESLAAYVSHFVGKPLYHYAKHKRQVEIFFQSIDTHGLEQRFTGTLAELQSDFEKHFKSVISARFNSEPLEGNDLLATRLHKTLPTRLEEMLQPYLGKHDQNDSMLHIMAEKHKEHMVSFYTEVKNAGVKLPKEDKDKLESHLATLKKITPKVEEIEPLLYSLQGRMYHLSEKRREANKFAKATEDKCTEQRVYIASPKITSEYVTAYREAYVDSVACRLLDCEAWEYLSISLYENIVPKKATPNTPQVALRVGSVLNTLQKKSEALASLFDLTLSEAQLEKYRKDFSDELTEALQKNDLWNKDCGKETSDNSEYVQHSIDLIDTYRDIYLRHNIAQPLESYINSCLGTITSAETYRARYDGKDMNALRSLFHTAMRKEMCQNGATMNDAWYTLLYFWMKCWE